MVRPFSRRRVSGRPGATLFKPAGIPGRFLETVLMTLDEFEAIRLADGEGLRQEEAALLMQVSRPTFGRILETAHGKIARVLLHGLALHIEGGAVHSAPGPNWSCKICSHQWQGTQVPPGSCPHCHSPSIESTDSKEPGTDFGRGPRRRHGSGLPKS
jgi:predicted DNA-binding protein (UPF0251 family)